MSQLIGLVLAGGSGRRMGRPKAGITVGGTSLTHRAAGVLWPLCGTVLVSLGEGEETPAPEYPVIHDEPPAGRGPLAGIASALAVTGDADLLVLACDYPGMTSEFLETILVASRPGDDLVFPTDPSGRDHPLVGLWRRSAEAAIRESLGEKRYKVRSLLADLAVRRLHPDAFPGYDAARVLLNVNTPEDLERV
jgi:molybdopterin-guanine dinucleotide biosynthesis protein A